MKQLLLAAGLLVSAGTTLAQGSAPAAPGTAATPVDLAQCLADNTSGKDRKDLARWVFFGMAAHPEIKSYTVDGTPAAALEADKQVAALFTRLLTQSCLKQARATVQSGGANAVEAPFEALGRLAMQELMTSRDVSQRMGQFVQHLDQAQLNQLWKRD